MSKLVIQNATVISPGKKVLKKAWVSIQDGVIVQVSDKAKKPPKGHQKFDADGRLLVPGFIDIHTHGAGGYSPMYGGEDDVRGMAEIKLREGVTSFLPTTWTASHQELVTSLQGIAKYMKRQDFARTPAVHIEGPYINPDYLGAQSPDHVRLPDTAEVDDLARIAPIALLSLAPEMEGGVDMVRHLKKRKVTTSLAHSGATYEHFRQAKKAGLTHLTHFCNQMSKLHHREIGAVGAGLFDDDVNLEMICDKIHLCPEMINLVFKHRSLKRIMLITDSISASWMPDGEYEEGGQKVYVVDGVCRLKVGNLAGSTLRFHQGLKNVRDITGIPLRKLIRTTSWNQAKSLGLKKLGKIKPGFLADFALLDPDSLEPQAAFVDGQPHEWP